MAGVPGGVWGGGVDLKNGVWRRPPAGQERAGAEHQDCLLVSVLRKCCWIRFSFMYFKI